MKTIFITGNDTEIGKTWVAASLVRILQQRDVRIQVVKAVETGVTKSKDGDACQAIAAGRHGMLSSHTLYSFEQAMAPLDASLLMGVSFCLEDILEKIENLPECDWRIIEGAGGLAVPLSTNGKDWADFANLLGADMNLFVLENRLGAINQGRLMMAYAESKGVDGFLWLNETKPEKQLIKESNYQALDKSGFNVVAEQSHREQIPHFLNHEWLSQQ